ncbi:ATP-binding cassette domain-containing protein [Propionibacterium australiense]|uniref:ATP-binding cassette domain-containing protein n=1 Tax=Propionibacterium australiense TaxID=119981 RepID=A0A8B3FLD7_9ACTN|nr:ATP-binding cassette domain-containing protein [Propionibacterium australiense]RLP12277.1 ATP-binding cassette domain-containing protein [Propionibacterium australiense]
MRALDGVDLELSAGQGLGVVGPSGSGKSTLLHVLIRLAEPDTGRMLLDGKEISRGALRDFRRAVQFVPQDPAGSLDPRRSVLSQVREPLLRLGVGGDHESMVQIALSRVGLPGGLIDRRASALSGGEAQRVAVARAIVTAPRYVLADEPTSGLDAPLRLQVLDLLAELRCQGVGVLLVSHDLSGVNRVCTDLLVLDRGRVAERGEVASLMAEPRHEMTRTLISAIPRIRC